MAAGGLFHVEIINNMQLGFIPQKGAIDIVPALRELQQKECHAKKKLCICFYVLEKPFDRVTKIVMVWMMDEKECQ